MSFICTVSSDQEIMMIEYLDPPIQADIYGRNNLHNSQWKHLVIEIPPPVLPRVQLAQRPRNIPLKKSLKERLH